MTMVYLTRIHSNMAGGQLGKYTVRTTLHEPTPAGQAELDVSIWDGPQRIGCGTLMSEGDYWRGNVICENVRWTVVSKIKSGVLDFSVDR